MEKSTKLEDATQATREINDSPVAMAILVLEKVNAFHVLVYLKIL